MASQTYYDILGVSRDADYTEIRKTFRRLVKKVHPDSSKDKKDNAKLRRIIEAYFVLKDPKKRGYYDQKIGIIHDEEFEYDDGRVHSGKKGAGRFDKKRGAHPEDWEISLSIGKRMSVEGDYKGAFVNYKDAINKAPWKSEPYAELGWLYLEMRDFDLSEDAFKNSLSKDKSNARAWKGIAFILMIKGDSDMAAQAFHTCLRHNPFDPETNLYLGQYYFIKKDYANAEKHLMVASASDKTNIEAQTAYISLLITLKRYSEANSLYKRIESIAPMDPQVREVGLKLQSKFKIRPLSEFITRPKKRGGKRIVEGELTIPYHSYRTIVLSLKKGETIDLFFEVARGSPVNLLFMKGGEYRKFEMGERDGWHMSWRSRFKYIKEGSKLGTKTFVHKYQIKNSGLYCVVMDNTGRIAGGAEPNIAMNMGKVDVELDIYIENARAAR